MKFHDTLAIFSVIVFSALSVVAQCPAVVLSGLHDLTNITYTATIITQAVTEDNAYAQVFRVGAEFVNIIDSVNGNIGEIVQSDCKKFPDDVALDVITALGLYVKSYIVFLEALVVKHDILVSKSSPFNPDGRPIAFILPTLTIIAHVHEWILTWLIPTRKGEADALIDQLVQAFRNTVKVYPSLEPPEEMLPRIGSNVVLVTQAIRAVKDVSQTYY